MASSSPAAAGWVRLAAAELMRTPLASLLIFASWVFFLWVVGHLQTPTGTLEPMYGDHLRHVRYTLDFTRLGFGIYSTAARDLTPVAGLGNPVWPNLPYLYPPAALLIFAPLAAAIAAGVPVAAATKGFLVFLLTVSHLGGYQLNGMLQSREGSASLRGAMVALFILTATFWSLNAQYDVIPAYFVLLSGSARSTTRSTLWAIVAISLKFQSLLILPFVFWRAYVDYKAERIEKPSTATIVVAAALTLSTGVALLLLRNDLSPAFQNRIGWHEFSANAVVAAIVTVWIVGFAIVRRDQGEAVSIVLVYASLALAAIFQQWYSIIILALLAHFRRPARWELFAIWYVGMIVALQWFPNPFRFWSLIAGT
jgi:hypothetical protein